MGARTRVRRLVAVGGAVVAVAAGTLAAAPAVSASTIVDGLAVTFPTAPAVTGSDVSLTYKVNRSSDQIRRRVCALKLGTTKVATDCGTLPVSTRPTTVTVGFTGLADGTYTYVVKVTDTTGTTARASKKFTIDSETLASFCAQFAGATFNEVAGPQYLCGGGDAAAPEAQSQEAEWSSLCLAAIPNANYNGWFPAVPVLPSWPGGFICAYVA